MKNQTKKSFLEKRNLNRRKTVIKATIFHDGTSIGERCFIRDASEKGAKIYCTNLDFVPDLITLEIEGFSTPMQAEIVWRDEQFAGVKIDWANTLPSDFDTD
jgi:PilZ domain-containing protein